MGLGIRMGPALLVLIAVMGLGTAYGLGGAVESVKIGNQTWMKKNLNIKTENSWCFEDKNANCAKYGRLYTWEAAKAACQSIGWRLPSNEDWNNLIKATGGGEMAGEKLKSKTGWKNEKNNCSNGTDDYGFSALPGGAREYRGYLKIINGDSGNWWTDTETSDRTAHFRTIFCNYGSVVESSNGKGAGYYVRCVAE